MIGMSRLFGRLALAGALLLLAAPSYAQQPDVGDEPGLIANDDYELPPELRKQMVFFRTSEAPGTIVVQTSERYLYLVQGNNRAIRYGIGVGREGFTWQGLLKISRKAEWPDWVPPPEMIQRQPYLPRFMAGGPGNPLGARAMYLGSTVYRIHGTNRPRHDRHRDLVRLLPAGQCRRRRPLRARAGRHQGGGAATPRTVTASPDRLFISSESERRSRCHFARAC